MCFVRGLSLCYRWYNQYTAATFGLECLNNQTEKLCLLFLLKLLKIHTSTVNNKSVTADGVSGNMLTVCAVSLLQSGCMRRETSLMASGGRAVDGAWDVI